MSSSNWSLPIVSLRTLTGSPLIPGAAGPVLYPGQPEVERAEKKVRDGIVIDREHHGSLVEGGQRYGVAFPAAHPLDRPPGLAVREVLGIGSEQEAWD